ncbi:MAG: SDR family NAD(P)-dependent oxidoreductase [Minwuia sp.]|uniref:SDR family NAD(P)-dependent oxidoreductase n=1 Tax=Minwuia sp. TaxID=2493630 RepID=UPI003A87E9F1
MDVHTRINPADLARFADLSEDRNPIHTRPEIARYTHFGQPIVFGVQTVLTALEHHLREAPDETGLRLRRLAVKLPQPLYVDEVFVVTATDRSDGSRMLRAAVGDTTVAQVKLEFGEHARAAPPSGSFRAGPVEYHAEPLNRDIAEALPVRGSLPLGATTSPESLFPACCGALGAMTVMSIIRLSTLVGMEWPGMYSVLSEFEVNLEPGAAEGGGLDYEVARVDDRVSMTWIDARSPFISASVLAMFRPEPVAQPDYAGIVRRLGGARPYAGKHCLVVGGSRGLGEVAAKLVAAGGGRTTLTYRSAADRAGAIAEEISQGGGQCATAPLDVLDPTSVSALPAEEDPFDAVMYFATPHIFRRRVEAFSPTVLESFMDVYVHAFHRLVARLTGGSKRHLSVLYPSTVAIDEPVRDLLEYSVAKAAGETLCRNLDRQSRRLDIVIERFPRVQTDQTNTIATAESADPVDLLLPVAARLFGIEDRPEMSH